LRIIDLGSQVVRETSPTYRTLFDAPNWEYIGLDVVAGVNVDVVVSDPYCWDEIQADSADVVISGQALEHVQFFWMTAFEIGRVLKPGGITMLIAPSSGYEHRYPVDCWRFYRDGMEALAEYLGFEPMDACTDWGRGTWADSLLVMRKPQWTAAERAAFDRRRGLQLASFRGGEPEDYPSAAAEATASATADLVGGRLAARLEARRQGAAQPAATATPLVAAAEEPAPADRSLRAVARRAAGPHALGAYRRLRYGSMRDVAHLRERLDMVEGIAVRAHQLGEGVAVQSADALNRASSANVALAKLGDLTVEAGTQWARIHGGTQLAAIAPLVGEPLVSVVLATRNRRQLLLKAVDSVRNQSYGNWQLIVVDDGSNDDSAGAVQAIGDSRITVISQPNGGAASARNAGLAAATGEWVAFLDDDNVMAPHWLRAIALAIRDGVSGAVYGAQLRQRGGGSSLDAQVLFAERADADVLEHENLIDLGQLAVQRAHPELHFDESLQRMIDWELVMRLARTTGLTALPVWASIYFTGAPQRITAEVSVDVASVVARFRDPDDSLGQPGRFAAP
jgi:hypothetical protein